jgi:chaperonin GroES
MNEVTLKPMYDRILARPMRMERTAGGIELPENHKDPLPKAKIVATGQGYLKDDGTLRPLEVAVGDVVCVRSAIDVFHEGENYLSFKEEDVAFIATGDLSHYSVGMTEEEGKARGDSGKEPSNLTLATGGQVRQFAVPKAKPRRRRKK